MIVLTIFVLRALPLPHQVHVDDASAACWFLASNLVSKSLAGKTFNLADSANSSTQMPHAQCGQRTSIYLPSHTYSTRHLACTCGRDFWYQDKLPGQDRVKHGSGESILAWPVCVDCITGLHVPWLCLCRSPWTRWSRRPMTITCVPGCRCARYVA